jgi:hypothetical protein
LAYLILMLERLHVIINTANNLITIFSNLASQPLFEIVNKVILEFNKIYNNLSFKDLSSLFDYTFYNIR